MTYRPLPDDVKLDVLRALADGADLRTVAAQHRLDPAVVSRVASGHGYPDRAKLAWAVDTILGEKPTTTPDGQPRTASAAAAAPERVPTLIERGRRSPRKATQRIAARAEDALQRLADALAEDDEVARAKAAQDAERARIAAEVKRLEQQLAAARARLTGRAPASASTPSARRSAAAHASACRDAGVDPKTVRAWARAAGVDCPAAGKVPGRVVDAYVAAHRVEVPA